MGTTSRCSARRAARVAVLIAALMALVGGLQPVWATAGESGVSDDDRIVFARRDGRTSKTFDLWIMNTKGRELRRLTTYDDRDEFQPAASPDGRYVTYVRAGEKQGERPNPQLSDVYVLDLETGREQAIAKDPDPSVMEYRPAWSPDGTTIVFSREVPLKPTSPGINPEVDIYGVRISEASDGGAEFLHVSEQFPLVDGPTIENFPAWSPDGKKLAYVDTGDLGQNVWEIDLQSKQRTRRTVGYLNGSPAWGPALVFQAYEGDLDLWQVTPSGNKKVFDTDDAHERFAAWSANGKWIAYASVPVATCDGRLVPLAACAAQLWLYDVRTTERTRLTMGAADGYPTFVAAQES